MKKTIMTAIAVLAAWLVLTAVYNLGLSMWVNAFGMKFYTMCVLGSVRRVLVIAGMTAAGVTTWKAMSKNAGNV